jgi:hypothetical protein
MLLLLLRLWLTRVRIDGDATSVTNQRLRYANLRRQDDRPAIGWVMDAEITRSNRMHECVEFTVVPHA